MSATVHLAVAGDASGDSQLVAVMMARLRLMTLAMLWLRRHTETLLTHSDCT